MHFYPDRETSPVTQQPINEALKGFTLRQKWHEMCSTGQSNEQGKDDLC